MSNTNQTEVERLLHAGLDPLFVKLQQFDSPLTRRLYHAMNKSLCLIIATTRAKALAEGRKEALELIAKQSGWEDSYDHFARQLGLAGKYGHSCQNCANQPTEGEQG